MNLVRNRSDRLKQSQFGNGANLLNHYDTRPFRRYDALRNDDLKWVNLAFLPFQLRHGHDGHHFKGAVESVVRDDDNGPPVTLLLASDSWIQVSPIGVPPTDRAEAHYPDAFYILISLRTREPEVRAFRIKPDDFIAEVQVGVERRSLARRIVDLPRRRD